MTKASGNTLEKLLLVGLGKERLPEAAASRLWGGGVDRHVLLRQLSESLASEGHVDEIMAVQTRNELEFIVLRGDDRGAVEGLIAIVCGLLGLEPRELAPLCRVVEGEAALTEVFESAAGLEGDGLAAGDFALCLEAQYREARDLGLAGDALETLVGKALAAVRHVRAQTAIDSPPSSIVTVTLEVAKSLHGELSDCRGLLIGLGETSELLAEELQRAGVARWVALHPSPRRAEAFARGFAAHTRAWDELDAALEAAEIVICDRGASEWCVCADGVMAALRKRKRRPMLLIDVALPGDVEDKVEDLDDAFLYRLEDLERLALEGRTSSAANLLQARGLLMEERDRCLSAWQGLSDASALGQLREHFEAVRREVLAENPPDAAVATQRLVQRLLEEPQRALERDRKEPSQKERQFIAVLRRLFALSVRRGSGEDRDI